jgi:lysophospholipase L1-like esterase
MQIDLRYKYLALGDSYTIGESVLPGENFPNLAAKFFQNQNRHLDVQIIAKTGWTTDELDAGINLADEQGLLLPPYDFVSLLIGVNNQYRGYATEAYAKEFTDLLKKAIRYAGDRKERVIVLSIPDWGVTPFAADRDKQAISKAINEFNDHNRRIASSSSVEYLDITDWTRESEKNPDLLAQDGLHPSSKEYQRWAARVASFFAEKI